jgi:hypothetical protein
MTPAAAATPMSLIAKHIVTQYIGARPSACVAYVLGEIRHRRHPIPVAMGASQIRNVSDDIFVTRTE